MSFIINEEDLVEIVKSKIYKFEDKVLMDDIDMVCRYLILRYLKMSTNYNRFTTKEQVINDFSLFIDNIYSFIITFVSVVNSRLHDMENRDEARQN